MTYYTFEYQIDRGPNAWARYGTETIQLGPYASEEEAWDGLEATKSPEPVETARIVRVD